MHLQAENRLLALIKIRCKQLRLVAEQQQEAEEARARSGASSCGWLRSSSRRRRRRGPDSCGGMCAAAAATSWQQKHSDWADHEELCLRNEGSATVRVLAQLSMTAPEMHLQAEDRLLALIKIRCKQLRLVAEQQHEAEEARAR
uniref:Uncharacterized protein n=1 Tax=Tetradesmus obliquus TaxID=3088 RepID=A0A383WHR4_TETOB|eukprot:jgi/Sobl393_1/11234/SZX76664.1